MGVNDDSDDDWDGAIRPQHNDQYIERKTHHVKSIHSGQNIFMCLLFKYDYI